MMRWWLVLFAAPTLALADPVTLRTGEHETFTRFVVAIGAGTSWSVDATEEGAVLSLDNRSDGFDLSGAFDRIPRDRVAALRQLSPNELLFDFVCDCHIDQFRWRDDHLVVDVIDGPDPDAVATTEVQLRTELSIERPDEVVTPTALPNLLVPYLDEQSPVPLPILTRSIPPRRDPSDLSATQTTLIEELARAASQGILEASARPVPEDPTPPVNHATVEFEFFPIPATPGVDISNSSEFDLIGNRISTALEEPRCLAADLFELQDWADDRPFHVQYADLSNLFVGEFGELAQDAEQTLARLYLHFGFGVEARAILSADTSQSVEKSVLLELARTIDELDGPTPLILQQADCDTPGAMWAFLLKPFQVESEQTHGLLQDFFALPDPLRGHIAPRLAQGFVAVEEDAAAERLLRAIQNDDAGQLHDAVEAQVDIAGQTDETAALNLLSEQVRTNARTSPESMIRFIELSVREGRMIADADLVLAAAFRQEYRNSPLEAQLAVAESRARIQRQQYQEAVDLLSDRIDQPTLDARDELYRDLTQRADEEDFLIFAFETLPDGVTPETENEMAKRLMELGFHDRALQLLNGPAERATAAERRYLTAEAAIATGDFARALEPLLGMTDERARSLRSQALAGLGEFSKALSALPVDDEQSTTLQYRSGAWERLAIDDDPVLSDFAQTVLLDPNVESLTTLADRRSVLDRAEESRRAIEALLLRFDGDLPEDG